MSLKPAWLHEICPSAASALPAIRLLAHPAVATWALLICSQHKLILSLSAFRLLFPLCRVLHSQICVWFVLTLSLCLNVTPLRNFFPDLPKLLPHLCHSFIFCNTYYLTLHIPNGNM